MRILLCAPFAPDPAASHGGGAYLGALAEALAAQCELGVLCLGTKAELERLPFRSRLPWALAVPPRLRPTGAMRLVHQGVMLWRWRHLPLVAAKHWQRNFAAALTNARAQFRPDVILLELAQLAQYLPQLVGTPTVFTDHEAGCPANTRTGLGDRGDQRDRRLWHRYVHRHYPLASLLQALTSEDAAQLATQLDREVLVRPPVVAVPGHAAAPAQAPPRALFLGDYRHAPNVAAARRLALELLPHLRAGCPAAELWLAGPNDAPLQDLDGRPGLRRLGFQPDLAALLGSVRLLLAPVDLGGGFRVKLLTALAHGVPVVTNRLGARGLDAPAAARRVAEDDAGLAEAALGWLRDAAAAGTAGAIAHAWARAQVSADAVAQLQLARCRELLRSG
jgi:glycosyltransferase involved in cell wall biosynthesis